MSDTPNRPPAPPTSGTDPATDTSASGPEETGPRPPDAPLVSTDRLIALGPGAPGFLGEYSVLQKLGEGGMGAVYLAEDVKLKRKVAIKTMKPEFAVNALDRDRFVREARAAAAVDHDNIVPILHIGEAGDGTPYIVMPFLKGEMLDARLKRETNTPLGLVLKVAREVADGLAAAHAAGLIHRDIKPGNIWLEGDLASPEAAKQVRRCKILDFGLARSVEKEDVQLTASGAILGTPAYMSPEQARGEKVDHRADLFSLGATLYRMVTGQLPFDGPTPMAVLIALATETPPPIHEAAPHLPPELAALIERLMCKDRAGRPQSATEVAASVRQLIEALKQRRSAPTAASLPAIAPVPEPISTSQPQLLMADEVAEPAPVPARRNRLPWVLAALILVLVPVLLWQTGVLGGKKPTNEVTKNEDPPKPPPNNGEPKKEPPKDEPPSPDADRRAALTWLALGGKVGVNVGEEFRLIETAAELPKEPFQIRRVTAESVPVTDADLAVFKDCRNVLYIGLTRVPVGDAGLAHFAGCKGLQFLYLHGTRVGDAGLAHFADCPDLLHVILSGTQVTDAGLVHLKRFAKLDRLNLSETRVTAIGVTDFAKVVPECDIEWDGGIRKPASDPDWKAALWALTNPFAEGTVTIDGTGITKLKDLPKKPFKITSLGLTPKLKGTELQATPDAELAVFKDCKNLTGLSLDGTGITNAGLAHFADCAGLTRLDLPGTKVDDGSVAVIKRFTQLTDLILNQTGLTEKGVGELANALPGCRIQYGSTIEPATGADRKGAEYALSVGGRVFVNGAELPEGVKELPKGLFRLTGVNLSSNQPITDAGLANFKECQNIRTLSLPLGDNDPVSAAGFAHFKNSADALRGLFLTGKPVTNAGLAHFKDCKRLTILFLNGPQITDAGVAHFRDCEDLDSLDLSDTQVTDAVGATTKRFTKLRFLSVQKTKLTEGNVWKLAAPLPQCKIAWNGGTIEVASDADRKGAEYALSVEGVVSVNGTFTDGRELPKEPFRLTRVNLLNKPQVTDAGLAHLKGCKNLTELNLWSTRVTDAALAHLRDCKNLKYLNLGGTKVTDVGLAHLKDCKNFTELSLGSKLVTDAGLAHFKDCKNLTGLSLLSTQVTDASIDQLKQFTKLTTLNVVGTKLSANGVTALAKALPECWILWDGGTFEAATEADRRAAEYVLSVGGTVRINGESFPVGAQKLPKNLFRLTWANLSLNKKVTDAGLEAFKGCKSLTHLLLTDAPVGDAGLAHLKTCTNLTELHLWNTKVTDAGLAHLTECKNLAVLNLENAPVTDTGVDSLTQLTKLTSLNVKHTKLTAKGIADLKKALPNCKIEFTNITEQAPSADRKAAEWVLSVGGYVRVADRPGNINDAKELPNEPFRLTVVNLYQNDKATDKDLVALKECKNLISLDLRQTRITSAGLAHLKGCTTLENLWLSDTKVTDDGLVHLKECKSLKLLALARTQIGSAGLAHLKECKKLTNLDLERTKVTNACVDVLEQFADLTVLDLRGTGVTAEAVADLLKSLPKCNIKKQ